MDISLIPTKSTNFSEEPDIYAKLHVRSKTEAVVKYLK
jgi:hypothetical protein